MRRPGFTLIEMLISAAVFSIVFLIAAAVFTNALNRQRSVQAQQRVVADGRYILESIARGVRLGTVDYAYYRDPNGDGTPTDSVDLRTAQRTLVIRDPAGIRVCYRFNNENIEIAADCASGAQGADVTPDDLRIVDFKAYVQPIADPFLLTPAKAADCKAYPPSSTKGYDSAAAACRCTASADCFSNQCDTVLGLCRLLNNQPQVTLHIKTSTVKGDAQSSMQTTVVTRTYKR